MIFNSNPILLHSSSCSKPYPFEMILTQILSCYIPRPAQIILLQPFQNVLWVTLYINSFCDVYSFVCFSLFFLFPTLAARFLLEDAPLAGCSRPRFAAAAEGVYGRMPASAMPLRSTSPVHRGYKIFSMRHSDPKHHTVGRNHETAGQV